MSKICRPIQNVALAQNKIAFMESKILSSLYTCTLALKVSLIML